MRDFAPLEVSGLDVELRCPRCGPQSRLVDMANDAGESRCTLCAGSHIATKGMRKIFVDLGGLSWRAIETITAKSKTGATRCPSCHANTAAISVGYTDADICSRCVSAWFVPGTLFTVSAGKYGARTSSSSEMRRPAHLPERRGHAPQRGREPPRPNTRSTGRSFILVALPLIALGGAGSVYGWLINGGTIPYLVEAPKAVEEKPAIALVPEPEPAPATTATALVATGEDPMLDYPYGGRVAAEWGRRLTVLKARNGEDGAALYALAKQRALANGLTVDESAAPISVKPSPALLAKIGSRLTPAPAPEPPNAAPKDAEEPNRITTTQRSRKHVRVVLAPRETNTATLRIQFRAGAYDDAHHSGLTKLAQHAMLGASAGGDYEQLMLDLFAANATLHFETGVRESAIILTAPASEFEVLAKRLASLCLAPKIVAEGFEDAKSRAITSAEQTDINVLVSAIARSAFSEPGYQNDPQGDAETIRGITLLEVQRHVAGPMSPANATAVVSGRFDAKKFKSFLTKFSGGNVRPTARPKGELAGSYHVKSRLEVHLMAFPLALRSPRSVAAAHLAAALLQDRIFSQLRKLGVAYAVFAAPIHREWLDSVALMLPLDSEQPPPIVSQLNEEIGKLKNGGIDDETFERNRRRVLADFRELDLSSERLAAELAVGAGELEWVGPKVQEQIARMSKSELIDELGEQLSPNASIHVHFSPKSGAAAEKSAHR